MRNGEIKLVTINGGPRAGEVHVNGVVAGFVEYIPDDSSLPTCSGTYREKLDAVLLEMSFEDEVERIAQFRLRSRLAGTDGSTLLLTLSGKVTRNGKGEVVVDRFDITCE